MGERVHEHHGHGHHHQHAEAGHGAGHDPNETAAVQDKPFTDPVCGIKVRGNPDREVVFEGITYHFCSQKCMDKFQVDPGRFARPEPEVEELVAPPGTVYTCPMHPEIRQDKPGNCPICGMALEPVMPSLEEEENPELTDFRRRFWWTLPLTIAVAMLAMFGHRIFPQGLPHQSWIELALGTPVVLYAGWPFFVRCVQSFKNRSPNMWTLIGIGTSAAFAYSVVATVVPEVFPASFIEHGRVGVYFEAAAVII